MPHAGFRLRTDTPRSDNSRVRASDSHPKADTPCCPGCSRPCQHPEHAWSGNGQPPGLRPGNRGPRSARWCNVPSTRSGTIYRNRMSFPESLRSCTPGVSLSLDPVRRVHPDADDIRLVLRKNTCQYPERPVQPLSFRVHDESRHSAPSRTDPPAWQPQPDPAGLAVGLLLVPMPAAGHTGFSRATWWHTHAPRRTRRRRCGADSYCRGNRTRSHAPHHHPVRLADGQRAPCGLATGRQPEKGRPAAQTDECRRLQEQDTAR